MDQSIIRPYASALFESAKADNSYDKWELILSILAETAQYPTMEEKISSPAVSAEEVRTLFGQCCSDLIGSEGIRLLDVLAEHDRFSILPELSILYKSMLSKRRGVKKAIVVSAVEIDSIQKEFIVQKLEKRFESTLELIWELDPEIIGGLLISVDDTVIDASVRGRLGQMASALKV